MVALKRWLVCLLLVGGGFGLSFAQETPPAADPVAAFTSANQAWSQFETDIEKVVKAYRTATDAAAKADLEKQYNVLVGTADAKLKTLRTAAEQAYFAAPNKNADVVTTLARMLADDVRRDDYDPAYKLAKAMITAGCTDGGVLNFAGIAAYSVDDFSSAETWLKQANEAKKLSRDGQICLFDCAEGKELIAKELAIREKETTANDLPRVKLETTHGALVLELFENEAPEAVGNFVSLVERGYYNGLTFHRVLGNFMAQGGCPEGTGTGGPGYNIYCECGKPDYRRHFRGTLSMAHAGKNTGGSQFFITFRPTPSLNGRHTAFGRVIEGWDVLAKIQRRDPNDPQLPPADKIITASVVRKRDHAYAPRKVE